MGRNLSCMREKKIQYNIKEKDHLDVLKQMNNLFPKEWRLRFLFNIHPFNNHVFKTPQITQQWQKMFVHVH